MSVPWFSVVVPVRNGEAIIGPCVESLLAQRYPADCYEIIVVDNGSTDDTARVVAGYPVTLLRCDTPGPSPRATFSTRSLPLSQRRNAQHPTGEREAFDRMMLMRSREFAHLQARELCDRIVAPDATGFTIH